MKTKYFMTKKEYGKQLLDMFWDGKRQEYSDLGVIDTRVKMHNKFVAFTKDFIDNHDKIKSPFSKTIDEVYEESKNLLSETYPNLYDEKFWAERIMNQCSHLDVIKRKDHRTYCFDCNKYIG